MSDISEAISLLKAASIAEPEVMPVPTSGQIVDAEAKLGISLPPSFKTFLEEAGSYSLPYWEVYWIGDASLGARHIVEANRSEREEVNSPLADFLITFHNCGSGDQVCFDTRSIDTRGEYPVVLWQHELTPEENLRELEVLAPDFPSWLKQEVLYETDEDEIDEDRQEEESISAGQPYQCPSCDKEFEPAETMSSGLSPTTKINREDVETLWAGTILNDLTPEMTLKKDASGRKTESVSSGLNLREQAVAEEGQKVDPPPHYEILRILGEGGMGVVYEARQTSIDRTIALKMIKPQAAGKKEHRDKFLSEAVAIGDLDHPNIVPIHDLGSNAEGTLFYAMKEVKGASWKDVVKEKSLNENLDILMRVADAVAFAHSRGVIHRDLKPENVMLGDFGEVLLMDWGLAAAVTDKAKADKLDDDYAIGGTPCYMAPEMACGEVEKINVKSDVYLLGAVLFEIVSGKRPHSGKNVTDCLVNASNNVIKETDSKGELLDVALKAMATETKDRYGSVKEFQEEVREYKRHAESVMLVNAAREHLETAEKTGDYADYARAVFAYEEAMAMWPENTVAIDGSEQVAMAYATEAYKRGDLDLGLSVLNENTPSHQNLISEIKVTKKERIARKKREDSLKRSAVGLLTIVVLVLIGAIIWIRGEQAKTLAERNKALDAQIAEAEQRKAAEHATQLALHESTRARASEKSERTQKERAEIALRNLEDKAYVMAIRSAWDKVNFGTGEEAKELLMTAPERLRGWEWHLIQDMIPKPYSERTPRNATPKQLHLTADGYKLQCIYLDKTAYMWDMRKPNDKGVFLAQGPDGIAFSPSGRKLLRNTRKRPFLEICDTERRQSAVSMAAPPDTEIQWWRALWGALSKNERLVVAYSKLGVHVWNAETGRHIASLAQHESYVANMAFGDDDKCLLTQSTDGVRFFDTQTWRVRQHLKPPKGFSRFILSPHRTLMALCVSDNLKNEKRIEVYKLSDCSLKVSINANIAPMVLTFSPNENVLAAGYSSGQIDIWRDSFKKTVHIDSAHVGAVKSLSFSADSKHLVSSGKDHRIRVWNTSTGELTKNMGSHKEEVTSVVFLPEKEEVVSAGTDGRLKLWQLNASNNSLQKTNYERYHFSLSGDTIVSWTTNFVLQCFDTRSKTTRHLKPTPKIVKTVWNTDLSEVRPTLSISSDANIWAVKKGKRLVAWNTELGKVFFDKSTELRVCAMSLSHSGDRIGYLLTNGVCKVFEVKTRTELASFKTSPMLITHRKGHSPAKSQHQLLFSPDNRLLFVQSDRERFIWDINANRRSGLKIGDKILADRNGPFSPSGKLIRCITKTTNGYDCQFRDSVTGSSLYRKIKLGHAGGFVYGPNDEFICTFQKGVWFRDTQNRDEAVIWSIKTGEPVSTCKGHVGDIKSACFSPCGKRLATTSSDGTLRIWATETGEQLITLMISGYSLSISFSSDGNYLTVVTMKEPTSVGPRIYTSWTWGKSH